MKRITPTSPAYRQQGSCGPHLRCPREVLGNAIDGVAPVIRLFMYIGILGLATLIMATSSTAAACAATSCASALVIVERLVVPPRTFVGEPRALRRAVVVCAQRG